MIRAKQYFTLFMIGSAAYSVIEVIWRGYTHWSMALTGGVCLCGIYATNEKFEKAPSSEKCLLCSVMITTVEFLAGVILNIALGMKVWDYSRRPFNLLGQICLLYSFFWFLLSFPAIKLCGFIKNNFFD